MATFSQYAAYDLNGLSSTINQNFAGSGFPLQLIGRAANFNLQGGYSYSPNQGISGVFSGIEVWNDAGLVAREGSALSISGIQLSGPQISQYIFSGDAQGILDLALSGNDVYRPSTYGQTIDGGNGIDTYMAVYSKAYYTIAQSGPTMTISSSYPGMKTDTLVHFERIAFADGLAAYDIQGNAGQAYRLYQAALHRTPETAGVSYQTNRIDSGVSLHDVAAGFIASPEFAQLYGAAPNDLTFVRALYQNVLGRGPDAAGETFYLSHLGNGSMDRASVLVGFSESPENHNRVDPTIAAGIHLDYGFLA